MDFSQDERAFLINLLSSLQVNPAGKDAAKSVELVQSVLAKLNPPKEAPTT